MRLTLYANSLLLVMGAIFVCSWWIQSIAGTVVFNQEQSEHGGSSESKPVGTPHHETATEGE
ncbi:DUF6766 family protein [Cryobacterium sp. W22_MBD10_FK3]|uniref:DUF6766 family protein n=1 Tax=Cryobacterium sp. W22_MBD10_FK3 TaxID=3240273 RepID=UPI003F93DD09